MADCYGALAELDPNALNVVMTVAEGAHFGDKCLLSGGNGAAQCGEFFPAHLEEARAITKSGTVLIAWEKVFCEVQGHEKKFVICGGGHISMPLIPMCRILDCPVTVWRIGPPLRTSPGPPEPPRSSATPLNGSLPVLKGTRTPSSSSSPGTTGMTRCA